jgi:glycosidase
MGESGGESRLNELLAFLYGAERATGLTARVAAVMDRHRTVLGEASPGRGWEAGDAVLVTYGDTLQTPGERPLATLHGFLTEHLRDAFSILHVLPFFPYSSDDGFAVIDFRQVDPELGDWEDIARLADSFGLMVDLVLNHVSRGSLWFSEYLSGTPGYRDWFIEVDPAANLSRVVRPRSAPLLAQVRTARGPRWLWATFSADQIDLNYANPEVLLEMLDVLLGYVRAGAHIVRLDAVAYLWKERGTPCIHLPQTHAVVKLLRAVLEEVAPGCLLLTETNVPYAENRSYFADGDEAHLIYQFSLPPLLLHALHTGSTHYLNRWLQGLAAEPPPAGCTYLNFTASHDGVGLRPLEGLIPRDEKGAFLDAMRARGGFLSHKRNTDGTQGPYELNIGFFDAFRDPRAHPDPWHLPAFLVSQTVPLSLQGIPAVYIHSLTATPNDLLGVELSGRTRTINRRKWERAELERLLADPHGETARVFHELRRRLRLRRGHPAFHPEGPQEPLALGNDLLGIVRTAPDGSERIVCLYNFTPFTRGVALDAPFWRGMGPRSDLLTGRRPRVEAGAVALPPYGCLWLVAG